MYTTINYKHSLAASSYATPLLKLDEGVRAEIIHILLNSIVGQDTVPTKDKYDLYSCFKGSWGDGKTAEEYSKELREGITEPKEVLAW